MGNSLINRRQTLKNGSCLRLRSIDAAAAGETMVLQSLRAFAIAALACGLGVATATASPVLVTVDTSQLAGVEAQLAFDLIDGGPPSNTVTITGFTSDGTLGVIALTGDVSGALPGTVTLGDSDFFNEYLQHVTLGNAISFTFDATGLAPTDQSSIPDGFSFLLIDPATNLPLVQTSDPTGANALLLYSVGSVTPLVVYAADQVTVFATAVPEPGSAPLALAALLIAVWLTRRASPGRSVFRTRIR
jgi:hypothetical protein